MSYAAMNNARWRHGMMTKRQWADKMKVYRAERYALVRRWKAEHGCIDCGERDPIVLDLDHISEKKATIATMMSRNGLRAIRTELAKCVVRCSNCRRKKTARDRANGINRGNA